MQRAALIDTLAAQAGHGFRKMLDERLTMCLEEIPQHFNRDMPDRRWQITVKIIAEPLTLTGGRNDGWFSQADKRHGKWARPGRRILPREAGLFHAKSRSFTYAKHAGTH